MTRKRRELTAEQVRRICDPIIFKFRDTSQVTPLEEAIGQDRAVRAIAFGIDIGSPGYHMYALGPVGTGKTTTIMSFLKRKAMDEPVADDWCYVNNFYNPDEPYALRLPAGQGRQFQQDMLQLVDDLALEIPQVFESDEYHREQEKMVESYQVLGQQLIQTLHQKADERGFKVLTMPQGLAFAPIVDGKMINAEQMTQLDEATQERIRHDVDALQDETRDVMRRIRQIEKEARDKQIEMDREVARFAVEHLFEELRKRYEKQVSVHEYLDTVHQDILTNLDYLRKGEEESAQGKQLTQADILDRYLINLLVDHAGDKGAPVIFEPSPNHHNLLGRIENEVQMGALLTDFTMIKAGALHRANGGYLVLEARDVLTKPMAWEALKTALKSDKIRIGIMEQEYQLVATRTLEPQPIPLDVKVVLIGDAQLYYLLYSLDEDFRELFKVKADFATEMPWTDDAALKYAQFIAMICNSEKLRHFEPGAVAKVVEESSRSVADQRKLATRFGDIVDLIRQASYWSLRSGNGAVTADDVRKTIYERNYRSNKFEERLQEMIEDGTILIDSRGAVVGQVNGLSVLQMGDYSFGKPSRITARTFAGRAGMVAIERETEMGGPIHNKGVLILSGYLGSMYAQKRPLIFSASLTFEQLYEQVEGDSASCAELVALLSSLAKLPVRQDLAITGAVNQRGQVQAIGGVNEKIEGFFEICKSRGLTGKQGVLIPESNVPHLMLREDLVEAIGAGKFHIYPIADVDEALTLLLDTPAGAAQEDGSYPAGTVHALAQARLDELATAATAANKETTG